MARPRNFANMFKPQANRQFSEGQKSKGILDDFAVRTTVDTHTLNAKDQISGGSVFSGANAVSIVGHTHPGGAETDPIWTSQSGAYVQSGAYAIHTGDSDAHHINTWEVQSGSYVQSGAFVVKLNDIQDPNANTALSMGSNDLKFQFSNPASNGFEIEAIGAYQGDVFHVHQHTGNPGANTHLVHLESEDSDVTGLRVSGASVRDIKANCIIETACVFSGAGLIADKAISGASIFSGATAVSVQGHSHPETDDIWIVQSGGYVASGAYVKNWETQSGGYTTSGAMVAHMNQISGANVAHYADTNKHVSGALTAYMALASGSSVAHMAQASGAFVAHLADGINPHGVQTITNLSGGSVSVTSDVTTNSGAHVLNIVRATNATPPTASNFPQGTIYVQYTP